MHIIPRMKFQIVSAKTLWEVRGILEEETAARDGMLRFTSDGKAFRGEVGESDFKVIPRLAPYIRDDFVPVVLGTMKSENGKTVVDVKMRLNGPAYLFSVFWFGMTGFFFLMSLLSLITGEPEGWKAAASAAGFILFGQLLVRGGFYLPAKRARRKLEELLGDIS